MRLRDAYKSSQMFRENVRKFAIIIFLQVKMFEIPCFNVYKFKGSAAFKE